MVINFTSSSAAYVFDVQLREMVGPGFIPSGISSRGLGKWNFRIRLYIVTRTVPDWVYRVALANGTARGVYDLIAKNAGESPITPEFDAFRKEVRSKLGRHSVLWDRF